MSTNFRKQKQNRNVQKCFAFTPQANFPAHYLNFNQGEGDGLEFRLPFRIFSCLDIGLYNIFEIFFAQVNDTSDKITISGPKEGIDKAIHEIRIISDEQSKQSYEVLSIPKIYHPFITGPNNEYVNKMLAENASVRINVPPLPVMKDEISVAGETEGVQSVKNKIMDLFKDIVSSSFYFCTLF